jgi:hypothetical protein
MTVLEEKFERTHLAEVDGVTTHSHTGECFVDDTASGVKNNDVTMDPEESTETALAPEKVTIITNMEEIIQSFQDCLQVTGGDLAPEKCVRYSITHWWKDELPRMLQLHPDQCGIKIILKATSTVSGVKRKAPDEGHKNPGFFLVGDGRSKAHKSGGDGGGGGGGGCCWW